MDKSHQEELEKAFALIQEGKDFKATDSHWQAAKAFLQARDLLRGLAQKHPQGNDEESKIATLIQAQSHEYFHQTRESLMKAMEQEYQDDVEKMKTMSSDKIEYFHELLEDEDATKRMQLLASTFCKGVSLVAAETVLEKGDGIMEENDNTTQKQLSLEERLSELNANLPKGFKTSKERMQDINSGLRRLGLEPVNDGPTSNPLSVEPPKSAAQQVEDIISQAKDEVAMEKRHSYNHHNGASEASVNNSLPDDSSDHDAFSDDDDDGLDSILSDEVAELQNVDKIKDQVAEAQAKLAELVALMDTISSSEDQEEDEVKNGDPASFDPAPGKQMLREARQSVQQALKLWKVKARS